MKGILFIFVLTCVASAAPPTSSPAGVTAARLDGAALSGELSGWTGSEVVIQTANGEERIATDVLVSLRWPNAQGSGAPDNASLGLVELVDGTILPATDFGVTASQAAVTLGAHLPTDEKELTLPVRQIAAVKLRPLEPEAAAQWDEIRAQNLAGDVLVVLKRDGKSLDYVEGVLGDVTPEKIEFRFDAEPLRVDRAKVAGFFYYRNAPQAETKPRCVLHGRTGLRATAAAAYAADGMIHITTTSGVSLKWPLGDIHLADFSGGKIAYLSDLRPASEKWTPLVGLPADSELAASLGKPRRDQSAFGGPLSLGFPEGDSASSLAQTRSFEKGLAARSRTELVYRLPADFKRFVAVAGIEPATSSTGSVRLAIHADDQPVFESDIEGNQPPKKIDLNVAGVKRLTIVVDFGRNLDTGDWLNLCDARLVK